MTETQRRIISQVVIVLKKRYEIDATGHDWQHIERVWTMAKRLAKGENVDQFVLEMAALLHDVDDFKFKKEGGEEFLQTRNILKRFLVAPKEREAIVEVISTVSFKGARVKTIPKTLEGKIVQDADRLDALGAIGIARTFAFGGARGRKMYDPRSKPQLSKSFEAYKKNTSASINHFYEKLLLLKDKLNTPQAKKIAQHRHAFMETFLAEFFVELKGDA